MNNTLTEPEKGKDTTKATAKDEDKETDTDVDKSKDEDQENITGEKEIVGVKDTETETGHRNTTAVDRRDKYIDIILERTPGEGEDKVGEEEKDTGSEKHTGSSNDKVDTKDTDNSLNTVEKKDSEVIKPQDRTEEKNGRPDSKEGNDGIQEIGKTTDITEIMVIKDKRQEEKEKKEEQVDNRRDLDKVGPNDTKLRIISSERENTLEIFELKTTENATDTFDTNDIERRNSTTVSQDLGKPFVPSRGNSTRYTMYRAGGEETERGAEKPTIKDSTESTRGKTGEDETGKDSDRKTKEEVEKEKEKEREKEVNQSIVGKTRWLIAQTHIVL